MRIAYICDFFHPDAGYHPNLLSKYWTRFGHKVIMITSEMDKIPSELTNFFDAKDIKEKDKWFENSYGIKIIRIPLITYISGRAVYSRKIFETIDEIDPDVIFVNGNDSLIGIQLICRYKNLKAGLVTDSHMLEMASENRFRKIFQKFYRTFITPIILKYDIPLIRTQDDEYVEKCLGIPVKRCPWISFGTDMSLFKPNKNIKNKFIEKYNLKTNSFIVLYAGKIIESKGAEILVKAMQTNMESNREIVFVIVGNTEGDFGKYFNIELKKSKYRIIRYPTQKYYNLPTIYQIADIALFPKQCSLSFFDVQACGLPVVFEDNNINIDRSKYHNAMTYRKDSVEDFCKKISTFANMTNSEFIKYSDNAIQLVKSTYDYEIKAREYIPYLIKQAKAKNKLKGELI